MKIYGMRRVFLFMVVLFLFFSPTESRGGQNPVRVGVMLPLKNKDGVVSARAVDFYRGLVMAMDSLKKGGFSFRVYTYNTANTSINTILADTIVPHLDIVFGPDDRTVLKVISDFTMPYGTKVVDAFAPTCDAVLSNPNFYVAYAPVEVVAEEAASLFSAHFSESKPNVVLIDTKKTAHPFVASLKKKVNKVRFLQSDFTQNQLVSRLSKGKPNVLVLSSSDKESALLVMGKIASFRKENSSYDIRVLGYPEWEDYKAGMQNQMYEADTYVYTPFYNNLLSQRNKSFMGQYASLFRQNMNMERPVMAMFGFDCGYFMLKALCRFGREYAGQDVYAAPLQNAFRFQTVGISGGRMNRNVLCVHYGTDRRIELITAK